MPQSEFHFSISERKVYLRFFDVLIPLLSLYSIGHFYDYQYFNFSNPQIINWILSLSLYLLFFGEVFEMYNLKIASDKYLTLRSTILTVIFTTIFYIFTPIFSPVLPENRLQIVYFSSVVLVSILINRFIYIQFIFSPRFLKNLLIIAEEDEIDKIKGCKQNKEVHILQCYVSNAKLNQLNDIDYYNIDNILLSSLISKYAINEIIVSSNPTFISKNINNQLIKLFKNGNSIRSVDSFIEDETFRISENRLNHNFYNYFTFSKSHQNNLYVSFLRIMDILMSLLGIVFLLFLVPIISIGNLLNNKGTLFYTQLRVGKKGEEFKIIKFRSMIPDAEKNGVVWAQNNDRRVTRFGRILRKTRLDEVPQFINVLKGEMSLIGPRPERPEFVEKLENEIPYYSMRHVVKPGLTGWAQVMHPYASTVNDQREKLMYDLYYIKERNLLLDFKIIVKTISTILFFRGT